MINVENMLLWIKYTPKNIYNLLMNLRKTHHKINNNIVVQRIINNNSYTTYKQSRYVSFQFPTTKNMS